MILKITLYIYYNMTNDERLNNQSKMKNEIDWFDISYNKTEWGLFYSKYKEQSQLQLQKALQKNENKLNKMAKMDIPTRSKYTQHLFYLTEWDEKEECFKTPSILLRHTKHGYDDNKWNDDYQEYKDKTIKVFTGYYKRCIEEHKEVKAFYEQRKATLELEQKITHKERANEKIICPFCQTSFARTNLARHAKTNKKCLEIQSKNMTNA